jgi:hypothetical protein
MNKKKYLSPEFEIVSLNLIDTIMASTFVPEPQNPGSGGKDAPIEDDL